MKYNEQFIILEKFNSGGILRQHFQVNESHNDYNLVRSIGWEKAKDGCKVDIMPILNEDDTLRKLIYPDAKGNTNADLRINGLLYEVEQPLNPKKLNNLRHRIDNGSHQADFVIIDLIEPISYDYMRRICKGRFIDHKELKSIEFRFFGEYKLIQRESVL